MARKGQSAARLRELRRKYKLGEFAPKGQSRARRRLARTARKAVNRARKSVGTIFRRMVDPFTPRFSLPSAGFQGTVATRAGAISGGPVQSPEYAGPSTPQPR